MSNPTHGAASTACARTPRKSARRGHPTAFPTPSGRTSSAPHRPSCPSPSRSAWSWASLSSNWRKCRRPMASGASPTCWSMPAAISFTVSTAKFEGWVTVLYDRGGDAYVVELHRDGELVDRHDEVYFDMLGEVLERLIDDGRWRLIDVSVIDAKASRRREAVPA